MKFKKLPHSLAVYTSTRNSNLTYGEMPDQSFNTFTSRVTTRDLVSFKNFITRTNRSTSIFAYMNQCFHCLVQLQIHFFLLEFLQPLFFPLTTQKSAYVLLTFPTTNDVEKSSSTCIINVINHLQNLLRQQTPTALVQVQDSKLSSLSNLRLKIWF